MNDNLKQEPIRQKKAEWVNTRLGGLVLTSMSFILSTLIMGFAWEMKLSGSNVLNPFYRIVLSIMGLIFIITGIATSYLTLILWNYRSIRLITNEQKISLLQEKIKNRYQVEIKGPKRMVFTKWDDEWIISKDLSKGKIHLIFKGETINNGIGLFLRINPEGKMNSDLSKELEDIIVEVLS